MSRSAVHALIAAATLLAAGTTSIECSAQSRIPRVGVLAFNKATLQEPWYEAFIQGLGARGWVPGKNVVLEHRVAQGEELRFNAAAEELVQLKVDVLFSISAPSTAAAHAATKTLPLVAQDYTNDPVAAGYADSYGRPGRNLTGVFLDAPDFAGKWIELLRAIVPGLKRVAVLWDPAPGTTHLKAVQSAAQAHGLDLEVREVRSPRDLEKAFASFGNRPQALIILPSPMTWMHSGRLAGLALKYRLPATSMAKGFAEAGGAITYGPDLVETAYRNGIQVARILEGAKPGELPIERPNKFNFIVNMKTIRALGLKIPDSLLPGAEQVGR